MKNVYLEQYRKEDCNGCGICTLICPKSAIKMVEDSEGFFYPKIDEEKCIHCNQCKNICSNFNPGKEEKEKAYMVINKNKEVLKKSASGGMFYRLAQYTIEQKGGVVFGVEYGENLKVQHNYYETLEECKKFQGSKYVRSDLRNCYEQVKEFLEKDRLVLFTGTPCQCHALKVYLKKEYEKLILCDIICHANPSPKVLEKYRIELENKYHSKISEIHFRSKENGWKNSTPMIKFENGKVMEDRIFYDAFVQELINRPSCHNCKFSGGKRTTDITMGDLWGVHKILPDLKDNDTGISLVTVNSNKGYQIFGEIKEGLETKEIDKELAFSYNHCKNIPMHKNREKFFRQLHKKTIISNMADCIKMPFKNRIKQKVKKVVRKILK